MRDPSTAILADWFVARWKAWRARGERMDAKGEPTTQQEKREAFRRFVADALLPVRFPVAVVSLAFTVAGAGVATVIGGVLGHSWSWALVALLGVLLLLSIYRGYLLEMEIRGARRFSVTTNVGLWSALLMIRNDGSQSEFEVELLNIELPGRGSVFSSPHHLEWENAFGQRRWELLPGQSKGACLAMAQSHSLGRTLNDLPTDHLQFRLPPGYPIVVLGENGADHVIATVRVSRVSPHRTSTKDYRVAVTAATHTQLPPVSASIEEIAS
jgi:hypothetical protein